MNDLAFRAVAPVRPRGGWATLAGLAMFVPFWLSRPLGTGEASLAFAIPFLLAAWSLARSAPPGAVASALRGRGGGRGLWVEGAAVVTILVMATLSMTVSSEPARAFRVILPMAYAVCALLLLARAPPLLRRRLVYAMLFGGVLALALALLLSQFGAGRLSVMRDYRFRAGLENANQLGVMVIAIWPLAIAMLLNARTFAMRLLCLGAVLVLAGAVVMSGTKTALALCFVSGAILWLYHSSRSGSLDRTLLTLVATACAIVLAVPVLLWLVQLASPVTFDKLSRILADGVWEYRSMQSRDAIWQESIRLALAHPLLGNGAGTRVLGFAHSHNLALDYFRGMGVVGLVAVCILSVSVLTRSATYMLGTWRKGLDDRPIDVVTAAMYLGASFYLVGNHLSDSMSPTTAFPFWMLYVGACLTSRQLVAVRPVVRRPRPLAWAPRPVPALSD